jgi:DNA-binding IclR family transcriptional regulator
MARNSVSAHQIEMQFAPINPALTAAQAACMNVLRLTPKSKSQIAIAARLGLARTSSVLTNLVRLQLAQRTADNRWRKTPLGRNCRFHTLPDKKRRGDGRLGHGAERALQALDHPMSGSELAARLGVTKQRAHQLVVRLHAAGRVRLGEPRYVHFIVARTDDPTPLLSRREQRVFSAIPEHYATTAAKIRLAAKCSESAAARVLNCLLCHGLIAREGRAAGPKVYRMTEAGLVHPQYRRSTKPAVPPSLPVRSERVFDVLSLLAERGQAQITQVRDVLGVPHPTINALFQYLKRKALLRKDGTVARSPYVLTAHGGEILAEMKRRRAVRT